MPKDSHKKIALVTISLAGGGAERSTAMLSKVLTKRGFNVHIITLTNAIDFEYDGTLFNLGIYKTTADSLIKRLRRFARLKAYFKQECFDYIIDNRNRSQSLKEWYYLNYIYGNERVIYVARSYKLDSYFPLASRVARQMIKKSAGIVGVSQAISQRINETFGVQKAFTIYNPVPDVQVEIGPSESYYIFVGRLVDTVKNVSLLIDAFAKANKALKTHILKICGDGPDKEMLIQKVTSLGLENSIIFENFNPEVFTKIARSRALVLTSHYEGFPRVLIEALSLGTPVISVDCKSGPSEIIKNEENGLLIENYNENALAVSLDTFAVDSALYEHCKANAVESVAHLSIDMIGEQWEQYLNNL